MTYSTQKYLVFMGLMLLLSCCRKKTDIKVTVFNPYLQQPVKDARVAVLALHTSNFFTSGWGKEHDGHEEIASGNTDENGTIFFQKEKLRTNSKYAYVIRLTDAWGVKNTGFDPNLYPDLHKGETNDIIVGDYTKGTANLRFNNLFVGAQPGDSMCILPEWQELFDPVTNRYIKGEGIENIYFSYDHFGQAPGNYTFNGYPDKACGKARITIRKRKQGVLTLDTMSVQFYPQQTSLVSFNW